MNEWQSSCKQTNKNTNLNFILGKDKEAIILLLSSRSNAQRQTIVTKYKETHKKVWNITKELFSFMCLD